MPKDSTNKNHEKNKNRGLWVIIGTLIVVIILLLLRSCSTEPVVNNPVSNDTQIEQPVGNFEVSGEQHQQEVVEDISPEVPTITFAGYGKYSVSTDNPNVELKNPDGNFVDMIFTLTDKDTGEVIARTGKVAAGKFVYVDVMEFYTEQGVYDVAINISTYDSQSGAQMNGMNQEMKITVNP